jgi:hypothetical protein
MEKVTQLSSMRKNSSSGILPEETVMLAKPTLTKYENLRSLFF